MNTFGSIIGGKERAGSNLLDVTNPYNGAVVGRVPLLSLDEVRKVLADSHATTFKLSRYERAEILNKIADRIEADAEEVSLMITKEAGLSRKDTRYEVTRAADVLRFAAMKALDDDSEVFPCDVSKNGKQRRIYTTRVPLKLITAITPFNHPLNQVVHKVAPAIATNNATVLKPSEKTPLSAYYLGRIAIECGLPAHMLNVICTDSLNGTKELVTNNLVSLVSFTGSSAIGKDIASRAGYKRLILELGGSSAFLILEDADIEEAVDITIAGIFKNSGQRCSSIRRILVHRSLADQYATRLTEKTREIVCADPFDDASHMGCVIDETAATFIEKQVNDAVARGAVVLCGNQRQGALYPPTVIDQVTNDMLLVANETFGPVAPILRFDTLDEAIEIANDTDYGLSGAVCSNHWPSIQRVISELETGTINVNEAPGYRLEWTPFGGIKDSGLGYKEGVIEAMKGMTTVKTYSLPWDTP